MADRKDDRSTSPKEADTPKAPAAVSTDKRAVEKKGEIGGPKGPEPTRYGDWEKGGRCIDF